MMRQAKREAALDAGASTTRVRRRPVRFQLGLRRFHALGLHQRSRTHQFELQVVGLSQGLVQICLQLSRLRSMICLGVGQPESTCGLTAGFAQGRFAQFLLNSYSTKTRKVTLEVAKRALSTLVMPTRRRSRYFSKKIPGVLAKT